MKRDKLADESKDIFPPNVIKGALKQASISDLLNEAFQRGLTVGAPQEPAPGSGDETAPDRRMQRWESLRRKRLQDRHRYLQERRGRQETSDIDEAIASVRASTVKHYEYVGALFDLLRRKRIEKMRDLGIQREDTAPEFALLGSRMTKAIFEHLVVIRRDALDAGACDIESLWDYFMGDAGYRFADGMVKGDPGIPPDLWSSFIYAVIQEAAISFLDIAEEDVERSASYDNEGGNKKPDFIN
ncbi:MAG: hypothetical protein MOB07_27870 [Acidobacteria bacterium]|nr:hypothetical protein [Acidobacteriota bacterium]